MDVAYHSTDVFAPVLGTSMISMLENNKACVQIRIWIIDNHISLENKRNLFRIAEHYGRELHFIPMPDFNELFEIKMQTVKRRWLFDSYCRLFLGYLLPGYVQRALYLDCDTLTVDSLTYLWEMDLQSKYAAAAMDALNVRYYDALEISRNSRYCNSGVILFDLNKWREYSMEEKVIEYVKKHNGYVFFMEQTVFNALMQDKIMILPMRYNVSTLTSLFSYKKLIKFRKPWNFYSETEYHEGLANPTVYHMTSLFCVSPRAWVRGSKHPQADLYARYASGSPFGSAAVLEDNRGIRKKITDAVLLGVSKSILMPIISFIYNNLRILDIKRKICTSDITFDFTKRNEDIVHDEHAENWNVTVVNTNARKDD